MIHTISGSNFHGPYEVTVRGPSKGFTLSPRQARKISRAMCGCEGCQCGGGYGDGPNKGSARMVQVGYDRYDLLPGSESK